jgi:hypothetical protein
VAQSARRPSASGRPRCVLLWPAACVAGDARAPASSACAGQFRAAVLPAPVVWPPAGGARAAFASAAPLVRLLLEAQRPALVVRLLAGGAGAAPAPAASRAFRLFAALAALRRR